MNWKELSDKEKYAVVWDAYHSSASGGLPPTNKATFRSLRTKCSGVPEHLHSFAKTLQMFSEGFWEKEKLDITGKFLLSPDKRNYVVYTTDPACLDGEITASPIAVEVDGVIRRIFPSGVHRADISRQIKNSVKYLRNKTRGKNVTS